jgi:hypothetical protein
MGTLYEALLPSGRAVRYVAIETEALLDAEERAADFLGGKADAAQTAAYQQRFQRRKSLELAAAALRYVAGPVEIRHVHADQNGQKVRTDVPDVDATLDAVPEHAWKPVNYVALMSKDGELAIGRFLADPRDWVVLCGRLDETMGVTKNIQVFTGKARSLSR